MLSQRQDDRQFFMGHNDFALRLNTIIQTLVINLRSTKKALFPAFFLF